MVKAQEWLEENYPDKETNYLTIYINQQLEGELDCSGYNNLYQISISFQVDSSKFEITNAFYKWSGRETEIIHCIHAQEWLDRNYPKNGTCVRWNERDHYNDKINNHGKTRTQITKLDISKKNLEGSLDLSDFTNLEELDCSDNKLTSLNVSKCDKLKKVECWYNHLTQIIYPANPEQLTELTMWNNDFPPQDLSIFSQFRNLEKLDIGDNPFFGSLQPLKDLKLKKLNISNTDINTGIEYLPESLEEIKYDTQYKPTCKLSEIKEKLDEKYWIDIHKGFIGDVIGKIHKKSWLPQGLTKEETKKIFEELNKETELIEPQDAKFLNWFLNFKNLDLIWALENEEEFKDLGDNYYNFGTCEECQQPNTSGGLGAGSWCQSCNSKHFEQAFPNWVSGNPNIDNFIQKCQSEATSPWNVLEWIPYEQFRNIENIANGGFGKVEKAEWKKGPIKYWNNKDKDWERYSKTVALKTLTNSQNLNQEFLQELTLYKMFRSSVSNMVPCYGISKDPKGNYIMVMEFMKEGNLREYLRKNYQGLDFEEATSFSSDKYPKLNFLQQIAQGLKDIHRKKLVHRDFHSGNIIVEKISEYTTECRITDLGLCKPVNKATKDNEIHGVLPYVAPEVLRGQPYTPASDVYSFGIVAYEILTCLPPYAGQSHEVNLALAICQGLRPQFPPQVKYPQLLVDLIKRCWDREPSKRPTMKEVSKIVGEWFYEWIGHYSLKKDTILYQQCKEAKEYNKTLPREIQYPNYQFPSGVVWHSKPINTKQITELLKTYSADLAVDFEKLKAEESNSDWTNINSNFTKELINQWKENNFTYSQTRNWINIGLQLTDYNFCAWLRDNKQLTPKQVLNKGNLEQLNQEYFQWWQEQQTNIEQPPKNS